MTPHQRAHEAWTEIVMDKEGSGQMPEVIIEQAIYDALREFIAEMKRRANASYTSF